MVHQCVVCRASSIDNKAISFHKFPKEETRRKEWMNSLNIDHVNDSTCICSQHFNKCDYKNLWVPTSRPLLKSSAVPSLCAVKSDVENASTIDEQSAVDELTYDPLIDIACIQNDDIAIDSGVTDPLESPHANVKEIDLNNVPLPNIRRLGDIKINEVCQSPQEAKICLEVAMDIIKEQRKKIRCYQTKNKKLEKSVHNLKSLLADSKNKILLHEPSATLKPGPCKRKKRKEGPL